MAKSKKSRKGRSRRQNRNGKNSYVNSVVKRTFQYVISMSIPHNTPMMLGSVAWAAASFSTEFKELMDLYAQCRLVGVRSDYAPQAFHASTSPTYVSVVGAIAHDPSGTAISGTVTYDNLTLLPKHRLFSSTGFGDMKWSKLNYKASLSNVLVPTGTGPSAGVWGNTNDFATLIGTTYVAAETQNSHVHTTEDVEILQLIQYFDIEFREPIADRGVAVSSRLQPTYLSTSRPLVKDTRNEFKESYVQVERKTSLIPNSGVVVRKGIG